MEISALNSVLNGWRSKAFQVQHTMIMTPTKTFKRGQKLRGQTFANAGVDDATFKVWLQNGAVSVYDQDNSLDPESEDVAILPAASADLASQIIERLQGAKITDNQTDSVSDDDESTQGLQSGTSDAAVQNKRQSRTTSAPVSQDNG